MLAWRSTISLARSELVLLTWHYQEKYAWAKYAFSCWLFYSAILNFSSCYSSKVCLLFFIWFCQCPQWTQTHIIDRYNNDSHHFILTHGDCCVPVLLLWVPFRNSDPNLGIQRLTDLASACSTAHSYWSCVCSSDFLMPANVVRGLCLSI